MSGHHHTSVATRHPSKTLTTPPAGDVQAEVAGLIAAGKCKQAVELAKEHHKHTNTPESQQLLVDAYVSRIGQFQDKGQAEDARTLIKLVKERFPAYTDRLGGLETSTAASGGLIDELVAPLAQADLSDSRREMIESAIRRQVLDLQALAGARTLPAAHPLKIAAAALQKAFDAATAGPVTDEQIALPEVSRRSPLAGWRMLIRAIAALHRNDDEGCRRALEAIAPDAAVAKLISVALDIITSAPAGRGAVGALQTRIANADEALREAINALENEFKGRYLDLLIPAVIKVLRAAEAARPELAEELRQRLMVRCVVEQVPIPEINKILGTTIRAASFWRLLARGLEQIGSELMACVAWERFIAHAINEKLFAPDSMEAAMVYGHMAGIVSQRSTRDIDDFRRDNTRHDGYASFYKNQPPHIAALAPKNQREVMTAALSPDALFRQATAIVPDGDTFRAWADWSKRVELPVKFQEDICLAWQRALPRDPEPPLRLSRMAEERNALSMAMKRLAEAEAIDPFNPAVRKARSRLIIATLWRHMKDRKAHLAEKDLADLEAIDAFKEGDRNAFLWAAKAACHRLKQEAEAATHAGNIVIEKMGEFAGNALLISAAYESHIDRSGKYTLAPDAASPTPLEAAQADARLTRLSNDVSITIVRPIFWDGLERKVLEEMPCPLTGDEIFLIGETQQRLGHIELTYIATSAGLNKATGSQATRFLVLRARVLGGHFFQRAAQCLLAAKELARQVHDPDLMNEVTNEIAKRSYARYSVGDAKPLDPAILAKILSAERDARKFPSTSEVHKHVVYFEKPRGFGGGGFGGLDDLFNPPGSFDDDEDEDDEYDDFEFAGEEADDDGPTVDLNSISPEIMSRMPPALVKLLTRYGTIPTPEQVMRDDPELVEELKKLLNDMLKGRK